VSDPAEPNAPAPESLILRFRGWLASSIAVAALLYMGGSVWAGFDEVGGALRDFQWIWFAVAIALTIFGNYTLRFLKWHWLTHRLGVRLPWHENAIIFCAGLAMVISPAKAGELIKPYVVRERTGVPMAVTIPALVAERLTDGIAALLIASVSVSRFASEQAWLVYGTIGVSLSGVLLLMHQGASMWVLGQLARLPFLNRFAHKLEELYQAMRTVLSPVPFAVILSCSVVAWFAECWAYQLLWLGFGREVELEAAAFLYAFATAVGGISPGGLGVADGALVALPERLLGLPNGEVVAAALLIRTATLWVGVLIGAMALPFVGRLLKRRPE
jgi:glycosyltransferase 2 family protein